MWQGERPVAFEYCELDNTRLLGLYVKELMKRRAFIFIQVANNKGRKQYGMVGMSLTILL